MNVRIANGTVRISPLISVTAILVLLVFIASFLPWFRAGGESLKGTDLPGPGNTGFLLADGTIGITEGVATLLLSVVSAAGMVVALVGVGSARRIGNLVCAVALGLAAAVGIVAWVQIQRAISEDGVPGYSVGWGLMLCAVAATAGAAVALISLASQPGSSSEDSFARGGPVQNNIYLGPPTNASAPTEFQGATVPAKGRVGLMEYGRPMGDVSVQAGHATVVGRDSSAHVRLNDPKASRRHLELRLESDGWIVRDLGATNPASIISADGSRPMARNSSTRMQSGQLAIGEAVITLYPVSR